MSTAKKKYAFVYLNTGSGHLAPAKAISEYMKKNFADETESVLINPFAITNKFVRFVIEDGYRILQSKAKWLYAIIYAVYKITLISKVSTTIVSNSVQRYLTKILLREKPDVVVICHFFCIQPVYEIKGKYNLNFTVTTLVTDPYTAHPVWFLRKDQNFVIFSERLKKHCLKLHIPEENLHVFPFILNDKFSQLATADEAVAFKQELAMPDKPIVLVLGGGDGIPNGERLLDHILRIQSDFEIAFVCGKNIELYNYALKIKQKDNVERLHVYGYVTFVYELLSISNIVITKCGASTFMEILMSRKIPVVSSYIWEQEKGNVDFIVENGLGVYEHDMRKLAGIVERLLSDREYFEQFRKRIDSYPFENGTEKVAKFIAGV